jgi:hypothetical protein
LYRFVFRQGELLYNDILNKFILFEDE